MTATPAEEVVAEIWAIRRDVQRILPGSHVAPHVFPEQILALARRLDELHTRVRNTFGGTPPRLPDNAVVGPRGRVIPWSAAAPAEAQGPPCPTWPVPAGRQGVPTVMLVEAVGAAAEFHRSAMADSSRAAYATNRAHFTAWCAEAGVDALPAVAASLAAYLATMATGGYAFAAIERRGAAVTHYHR